MRHRVISLILGGGAGTRLYPLTKERSKPAVPIAGKYRLIDIPISNCLNARLRRIFVLTQFNSASLNRHINRAYNFDQFVSGFVDVLAAEQTHESKEWFQGTADAVRQCMVHTRRYEFDFILVLSGDQLYEMDFQQMIDFHVKQNAEVTIATIPVNKHDAPGFGILKANKQGYIDSFIEKPSPEELSEWSSAVPKSHEERGEIYLASMGIYIFNKNSLTKLFNENEEATDFGKEIIPAAIKSKRKVASYAYSGYWTDIGNIKSFYQANLDLTTDIPRFNLFDEDHHVYTNARMLSPAKIMRTRLDHALIAEACIINAEHIEYSIIGIRSRIGFHTRINRAIVMGNDYFEDIEIVNRMNDEIPMGIGHNTLIDRAIIDKNCRIGDNVIIRGAEQLENVDTEQYAIVDGIVVVKKGAIIPSGSKIGWI